MSEFSGRVVKRRSESAGWEVCLETVLDKQQLLSAKDTLALCESVKQILMQEDTVMNLRTPLTLVGDIHGQWNDVLELLEVAGLPPTTNFLWLGDFVDRGYFSVECITLLFLFKVMHPSRVWLIRGNHESEMINSVYGFYEEIQAKFDPSIAPRVYRAFADTFNCLPLAAVIDGRQFAVHGGLSPHLKSRAIRQLSRINRFCDFSDDIESVALMKEESDDTLISSMDQRKKDCTMDSDSFAFDCERSSRNRRSQLAYYDRCFSGWMEKSRRIAVDLMWSDPSVKVEWFTPSPRGMGYEFGESATKKFVHSNGFSMVYRAHQLCQAGYKDYFGCLTTVWSAPNYLYKAGNAASVCQLYESGTRDIVFFQARPDSLRRSKPITEFSEKMDYFS